MHDNVPATPSFFRLYIEPNRPANESEPTFYSDTTHPSLSLSAHLGALSLLHPLVVLFAENSAEWPQFSDGTGLGLKEDLPCDIHLLNLRTAAAVESDDGIISAASDSASSSGTLSGQTGASALMMLHRVGGDCRRPVVGVNCSVSAGGKVRFSGIWIKKIEIPKFLNSGNKNTEISF